MSAFLPCQDPNPVRRSMKLSDSQALYRYSYTHVSPLALVDHVPIEDEFSFSWLTTIGSKVLTTLSNRADLELDPVRRDHHLSKLSLFGELVSRGEAVARDTRQLIVDALKFDVRIGAAPDRPKSLEDYADLFRTIGLPPIALDFQDDRVFAWQRLAGPNPVMLRRVTELLDKFPVTDQHLSVAAPGDNLPAALAEGRLYMVDYSLLEGAELGSYPHGQKYLYAPMAMFVVHDQTREFAPVAIQCKQKPATDNPIFTPDDGYNWLIAKTIVEIADGNVHEAFTHLGRTHLFMEPFVVSTFRQIAPNHPLGVLLKPHFEGTLAINEASWRHLIANKGAVDKLFGGSINTSRSAAVAAVQSADVMNILLPQTFAERGVDDVDLLPHYPYRDDSLMYWEAIHNWVTDYLRLYYQSDEDVQKDDEVQSWGREIASTDGGRIKGLPNDGGIQTVDDLISVMTLVIFTCSVQHAAVNFPQYDLMSYVPNQPLASYTPAPTTKKGATEADYLAMLPPLDMAELQMELGYLLGATYYTQLGQYVKHQFRDPRVNRCLTEFQHRLSAIGGTIEARNKMRLKPYPTLSPSGIPQSINI